MKLDRLLGILTVLLQNERITAPQLAAKFEVSRRTIGRDIDSLCMAGIPIVTHQGAGGGIAIAEGFRLDKSVLTTDELSGIIAAIKGIGTVSDTPLIERTLDKLGANSGAVISLREPIVIDLASYYKGQYTEKISIIKRAILEGRVIAFDYYYEKGETRRHIEPYIVIFQWTSWYVFGFCLSRQDWRMFKLTRLWGLDITDTHFTPREQPPDLATHGEHLTDDIHLTALFDPAVKHQLIDAHGLDCYEEIDDGLLFRFGYTNPGHLMRWLLGFGGKVTVLEPEWLAEELQAEAQLILENYTQKQDIKA